MRASIVVFIASFCTLVIEIVAGRLLAPYVGVSLYTWTSIIGVVLAGISAGAWAGGWVADRRPESSTLGWLLAASGVASILIVPATSFIAADEGLLTSLGLAMTLLQRVIVLSFLLFFLPSFLLGMISPVAVKLAVRDLETTGRVVGKIYAFSTLGSIAGTYATGFYFIARFGTRATLAGVGIVLIATALVAGALFRRRGVTAAAAIAIGFALYVWLRPPALAPPHQDPLFALADTGIIHAEESQYYTIQVERTLRRDNGDPLYALHLDHLVHSYSDPADPSFLEYSYLLKFQDVVRWTVARNPAPRFLFVGGGGYTLPRLVARDHPAAEIDVVEIDPAVTRIASRFFGLTRDSGIRTIQEDARWFAMREHEPYDAIIIDAFNDLSVPYHLTTREAVVDFRRLLRPDGVLVANVIDDFGSGRFLVSYFRTLESVFGVGRVAIAMDSEEDAKLEQSTFVVIASSSLDALVPALSGHVVGRLQRPGAIVLTDDYVPVDNMLAPLFAGRFVDEVGE